MKVDPAELRADIARKQIILYKLAAEIQIHPGRLGMMLGGKIPLPSCRCSSNPIMQRRYRQVYRVRAGDRTRVR
jgi:hypothetical protein